MENEKKEELQNSNKTVSLLEANSMPVPVGEWMWTVLVASIPLVGFVMLFVWAFSKSENVNKANWAKATLLWMLIGVGVMILFFSLFMSTILGIGHAR